MAVRDTALQLRERRFATCNMLVLRLSYVLVDLKSWASVACYGQKSLLKSASQCLHGARRAQPKSCRWYCSEQLCGSLSNGFDSPAVRRKTRFVSGLPPVSRVTRPTVVATRSITSAQCCILKATTVRRNSLSSKVFGSLPDQICVAEVISGSSTSRT